MKNIKALSLFLFIATWLPAIDAYAMLGSFLDGTYKVEARKPLASGRLGLQLSQEVDLTVTDSGSNGVTMLVTGEVIETADILFQGTTAQTSSGNSLTVQFTSLQSIDKFKFFKLLSWVLKLALESKGAAKAGGIRNVTAKDEDGKSNRYTVIQNGEESNRRERFHHVRISTQRGTVFSIKIYFIVDGSKVAKIVVTNEATGEEHTLQRVGDYTLQLPVEKLTVSYSGRSSKSPSPSTSAGSSPSRTKKSSASFDSHTSPPSGGAKVTGLQTLFYQLAYYSLALVVLKQPVSPVWK